jgi:hypothetical protein
MSRGIVRGTHQVLKGIEGAVVIGAVVRIPRLNLVGAVEFLVDTGASTTTIFPSDSERLRIDYRRAFTRKPDSALQGVVGSIACWLEPAQLIFQDTENQRKIRVVPIPELELVEPTDGVLLWPSILGRDVLRQFILKVDGPRQEYLLESEFFEEADKY